MGKNFANGPTGKELFDLPYLLGETLFLLFSSATYGLVMLALAPPVLGAIQRALEIVAQEPERRLFLSRESERFRRSLLAAELDILGSETQIIPVLVGDNARTLEFAARLMDQGLMAVALRPPTVPPGKARVRFSLSAAHAEDDLARAREIIVATAKSMGLGS